MNKVHPGDTVIIEYSGTLGDGTVVLASLPEDPYQFQVGHHETIPALEETVLGMSPGETRSISLRAEEAFGPYRPELIRSVIAFREAHPAQVDAYVAEYRADLERQEAASEPSSAVLRIRRIVESTTQGRSLGES